MVGDEVLQRLVRTLLAMAGVACRTVFAPRHDMQRSTVAHRDGAAAHDSRGAPMPQGLRFPRGLTWQVFAAYEDINSGGEDLKAQQLRRAAYFGAYIELLDKLAANAEFQAVRDPRERGPRPHARYVLECVGPGKGDALRSIWTFILGDRLEDAALHDDVPFGA